MARKAPAIAFLLVGLVLAAWMWVAMFDPRSLTARWQLLAFAAGTAAAAWGLLALLRLPSGGRAVRTLVVAAAFLIPAAWALDSGLR